MDPSSLRIIVACVLPRFVCFVCGTGHGRGEERTPSGYAYSGDWRNNLRHGRGKFVCAADGKLYVGDFADGLKHGGGTLTLPSGDSITGTWDRGELKGPVDFNHHPDSPWTNPKL